MAIKYYENENMNKERRENTQKTVDNLYSTMYNEGNNTAKYDVGNYVVKQTTEPDTTKRFGFDPEISNWAKQNQDAIKYAGDGAINSIKKAGEDLKKRYLKDKPAETDKDELFDSIAKWQLARDSNNKELAEIAMNNVIGHMSTENKDHYLKFRRMLGEYIKSKDDFDYKTGKYTTTEYATKEPDEDVKKIQQKLYEKGRTNKYGNKVKVDGLVGSETLQAVDDLENENNNDSVTIQNLLDLATPEFVWKETKDGVFKLYNEKTGNPVSFASAGGPVGLQLPELDGQKFAFLDGVGSGIKNAIDAGVSGAKNAWNSGVKFVEDVTSKITLENLKAAHEQGVNAWDIKTGYTLSQKADKRAREFALNDNPKHLSDGTLVTWGNEADAYRHFTWNYEMASKMGYSNALKISSAHEISYLRLHNLVYYTYTGDPYDRKAFMTPQMLMDVWNNLKGVNAYSELKDQKYDFEKAYKVMIDRNSLALNTNEALGKLGLTSNDIEKIKVGDEELEGVWVYFNYKNGYITNIRKAD